MADRKETIKEFHRWCDEMDEMCPAVCLDALELLEKSVSQVVVEQIKWERDIAISQLKEIGKGLGEKMDDVKQKIGNLERTT